jgi:hypothetical protein
MTDVEQLLTEYIAQHQSQGDADPSSFLARVSPGDRMELATLIDGYLARAPRRAFDADAFRGSSAERTTDELERTLTGQAGTWPVLLPRLRDRAGLKRSELVERLAAALGAGDKAPKVAAYYHQMEQGTLPAAGVSERVLAALGEIVGEGVDRLRAAGEAIRPQLGGAPEPQAVFTRFTTAPGEASAGRIPHTEPSAGEDEDEVDRLFRGGASA